MDHDTILEDLVKKLEQSSSKKLEDWKSLKEDLTKRKLKECDQYIQKISLDEAEKILPVIKKLEERFGYGQMLSNIEITGGSQEQLERIRTISKMRGDACAMLDSLADAGYMLHEYMDTNSKTLIRYITPNDVLLFTNLLEKDKHEKFYTILKTLKTVLGYDNRQQSSQHHKEIENLIELTNLKGDVTGAICLLAERGYKIKKELGLTENHVDTIDFITRIILQDPLTNTLFLYKTLKPDLFKEYFTSISVEKKKESIGKIFESDYQNEQVTKWLEESYPDILREVSFKD
ncbi:hypothetical protein FJZ53_00160 [Candidatus Woesearchaeota archaeon]|nr:hypothetical protein [Candidatus Woesearchaeota archaeon]